MPSSFLDDRSILRVSGAEARAFLQGLFTCDVERVAPGNPAFGALLTPQGKIIVDFVLTQQDDAFWLDVPAPLAADLLKRLRLYRLRAQIDLSDLSETLGVQALWGEEPPPAGAQPDPRHPGLGARLIAERATLAENPGDRAAYEAQRIACGIPQGGDDFAYGEAFPHEANMDLIGGVDFKKGCYVGQEVVSRVHHRGTARRRILPAAFAAAAPAPGTPVLAGEAEVGALGSTAGAHALASIRLDRAEDARAAGTPLTAGGIALTLGALPSRAPQG
jgi:folate-binding protein YgfZ